jgi:hypothetical protein
MHDLLLVTIRRFITLAPAEEDLLRQWFVPETVPKGGFFLQPGEVSRKMGFVLQGVFHYFQNGIQALEEAHLLTISYNNLQRLYREVREGERLGRLVAETGFMEMVHHLTSFYKDSPAERYARFVRTYPDLQQRIPQYYIASYVGVKPQSLSRIRSRVSG